jgi:hypothetical protein
MLDYVWCNRFLVVSAAFLFVVPFEPPPKSLSTSGRQAAKSREIRWEFDTGG